MRTNITEVRFNVARALGLVTLASLLVLILMINLLPFIDSQNALMDFGSFYASGLKIQRGENPYDPNSEYIFEINFSRIGAGGKMVNLNPPISVVIFRFLPQFDPHKALLVWQVISAVLYIGVVLTLASAYRAYLTPARFLWAFALAGFWHTLVLGQIYILLLAFAALGWIFINRKEYILAGVMIGLLISVKPNFVLWPLMLLAAGYWLTFLTALASSLLISLIPLLFYGTAIYTQWMEASALRSETLIMPGNNSILGLTARFQSIELGIVLSVLLVLSLLILLRQRPLIASERPEIVSALGILASILASPISWTGYTILALPVFFSLKRWSMLGVLAAAILCIPFAVVLQLHQRSFLSFIMIGWLYGWGLIVLLGISVKDIALKQDIRAGGRIADTDV